MSETKSMQLTQSFSRKHRKFALWALPCILAMLFVSGCQSRQVIGENLIIAGHSYGANTAMLLAGAQVERGERKIQLQDKRFSAAILISAPPFYSDESLEDILANLTIPTLHITTTKDEIKVPGFYSAPEDRIALFNATASSYKVLAVFYGGSHNIFTGRRQGPELATQDQVIKAATQSLSLAFIEQGYSGTGQSIKHWRLQHQTLLADCQTICPKRVIDRKGRGN